MIHVPRLSPSYVVVRAHALALILPVVSSLAFAQGRPTAGSPGDSAGGSNPPSASLGVAVRAERAPELDGRDTDEVWRRAIAMIRFRQFEPEEDGEPSLPTDFKVAYDDRNVYVIVRAHDPHPDSIVSLLSRRDVETNSDQITVVIDAYHDRRTGVMLTVNPAGVKRDASIYNDFVEDESWDGVWDAATRIDSLGWVAEFRIPLSQLRFTSAPSHVFGFAVARDIARRNESVSWPLHRTSRNGIASQLGEMSGFEGISRSSRLEFLPYTVAKNVSERQGMSWGRDQQISAGADLKYGITSNLTLDATVNPDFGQVEADPAVLNLTAFEVRFDERRPFFQEGVGLFRCGGPCEGIFYTRRIGRTPQLRSGDADPAFTTILGAAKLTGRLRNGVSVGLVEAVTRREAGARGTTVEPATNYLVGRAFKELRGGRSGAGVMFTGVNRNLDETTAPILRREAYTGLVQGFHRFSRERFELMGYVGLNRVSGSEDAIARTQRNSVHLFQRPDHEEEYDSTRTSLEGSVQALSLQKIAGTKRFRSFFRHATPGVELNDLGFVPLVNDVSIDNGVSYRSSRPQWFYRQIFASTSFEQHWTTGGLPTGTTLDGHVGTELRNNWSVDMNFDVSNLARTHCVSCARGGPALRLSPVYEISAGIDGDERKVIVPSIEVELQRGDGGRSFAHAIQVGVEARLASRFSMSIGPSYERRTDDVQWVQNFGAFLSDTTHFTFARLRQTTVGIRTRVSFTATPTLSLQLYAEPFVSSGEYSRWRELDDPRASSYERRFKPYGDAQALRDYDFNEKQFNSNAVLRWEYRPGSALFLVWQQGREQDDQDAGTFGLERDYRNLFRARPDNTFLVKVSYWFNP